MAASNDPTVPLDEIFKQTVIFHGRAYQRYSIQNNVYFSPIDEVGARFVSDLAQQRTFLPAMAASKHVHRWKRGWLNLDQDEVERLQISHEAFRKIFDNRLVFPPIRRLRNVLDCGFGSGIWAAEVAMQHPKCEVLGIDISPHMVLDDDLPNLDFQVDDLNKRFTFNTGEFDLVHSQMVAGGINAGRWKHYLKDMYRVLRPGGWCQIVEIYFQAQSDNGSLTDNHALRHWSKLYLQSVSQYKDPRAPVRMETLVRNAGFSEVESRVMQMPMCAWPTDPRMHEVGRLNRDNVQRLLASQSMYLFTERLGMPHEEARALIAQARIEADNPAIKPYFPLYVCIGRKRS